MDHFKPKRNALARMLKLQNRLILATSGTATETNQVGVAIWALCDGRSTVCEIAETIACQFDGAQEEILNDCKDFVRQLSRAGLIQAVVEE